MLVKGVQGGNTMVDTLNALLSLCVCDFPHYWPFACGTITKWAFRWSLVRWDIVSDTERNGICTHEAIISTNCFSSSQVIPTHLKIRWRYVKSIPSDIFADDMSIYPFFGWTCMYFDWLSFPVGPIIKRFTLIQAMVWIPADDKPLPESVLVNFTDAYVCHQPQWTEHVHQSSQRCQTVKSDLHTQVSPISRVHQMTAGHYNTLFSRSLVLAQLSTHSLLFQCRAPFRTCAAGSA